MFFCLHSLNSVRLWRAMLKPHAPIDTCWKILFTRLPLRGGQGQLWPVWMCGHRAYRDTMRCQPVLFGLPKVLGAWVLLTRSLGGAPGQGAGHVAFHVAQQSQSEAWAVRYPEQNLTSLPCSGRARQGVVYVNIHWSTWQHLTGRHVPHQHLQGKLGLCKQK